MDKELGKAIPYGVYDVKGNEGWASAGTGHDTAEFAREAIWRRRQKTGSERYPKAGKILITAGASGAVEKGRIA
jgi:hypothetical protein